MDPLDKYLAQLAKQRAKARADSVRKTDALTPLHASKGFEVKDLFPQAKLTAGELSAQAQLMGYTLGPPEKPTHTWNDRLGIWERIKRPARVAGPGRSPRRIVVKQDVLTSAQRGKLR